MHAAFDPRTYYQAKLAATVAAATAASGATLCLEVVKTGADRGELFVEADPLCLDAASVMSLLRAVAAGIRGSEAGHDEPAQCADFASSGAFGSEQCRSDRAILGRLSRTVIEQRPQRGRARAASRFQPGLTHKSIGRTLWTGVRQWCAGEQVEPRDLLLCAWLIVLEKYGRGERPFGVLADARDWMGLDGALGLYAASVPLRWRPRGGRPGARGARRASFGLARVSPHQAGYLLRSSGVPSAADDACGFEFHDVRRTLRCGAAEGTVRWLHSYADPFALKLSVLDRGREAEVLLHYDARPLAASAASLMLRSVLEVLHSFIIAPAAPVRTHRWLPAAEERACAAAPPAASTWRSRATSA